MNFIKVAMFVVIFAAAALNASAANMTIQQLVDSYNYDFFDGTINITGFSDYMADNDGFNCMF